MNTPGDLPSEFASAIEEARASGADDTQIALLDRTGRAGEITLDDLREAVEGTFKCLDAAGISYREYLEVEAWGQSVLRYDMSVPAGRDVEAAVMVADECALRYSTYVERLYVSQPVAVAMQDEYRNNVVRPHLMKCLDEHGIAYDDEATVGELSDTALYASAGEDGNQELKLCVMSLDSSW